MSMASKPSQANASAIQRLWRQAISLIPGLTAKRGLSSQVSDRRGLRAWMVPRRSLPVISVIAVAIVAGALASQFLLPSNEPLPRNNAIWLDRAWTYGGMDGGALNSAIAALSTRGIGKAYAYVSTLGVDGRWVGGMDGGSFMDFRADVAAFVTAVREADEALTLYAWMEIWTSNNEADGYQLDGESLHQNIADFSRLLIDEMGFSGLLLEVKPMFSDNGNLISLIRRVRSAIGLDTPIAIAVSADLTPHNLRTQNVAAIAPGTMWSDDFKKRVMVSADEVVLMLYQSYRQDAREYIDWVAYHVETYVSLLEIATVVYASIPHYDTASAAHNPAIETMSTALDGVKQGLQLLDEDLRSLLTGVAIYADQQLSEADWNVFREQWLLL